jgi:hypothetical protein
MVRSLPLLVALIVASVASVRAAEKASSGDWVEESKGDGVVIHSRTRAGSELKEFRGIGLIDAPPQIVFAVLDDTESYPEFMPYSSEVRVLKRDKNTVLAYQRLDLPFVSDRDYTLRSKHDTWRGAEGLIYRIRWEPANDLGPAEKPGVSRVNLCEGGWLLEPDPSGGTRAVYSIFTDNGGALPQFLATNASRMAIRKLFDAIRNQVKNPKYAATRSGGGAGVAGGR